MIPKSLYDLCDRRLQQRGTAVTEAEERLAEVRARAYGVSGQAADREGSRGSSRGDGLERKAIAVAEAEERLQSALSWEDVFKRLDRICPRETPEGRVAHLLYAEGLTQADCCRILGRERKRIRELKDTYVINCALLAVQAGLARMEE